MLLKSLLEKYSEKKFYKKQKIKRLQNIADKKSLELQKLSYIELCSFINDPPHEEYGEGESFYQIEIMVTYDDYRVNKNSEKVKVIEIMPTTDRNNLVNENLRVIVSVDDGGIMAYTGGVSSDFIITPEGEFL